MAVYDHWAYIFALLLYAPVRVEAAVVVPPPKVIAAQHLGHAPVVVAKPLPKVQCGCLTVRVADCGRSASSPPRPTPARKLHGERSQ
jgi:hypothetical protein